MVTILGVVVPKHARELLTLQAQIMSLSNQDLSLSFQAILVLPNSVWIMVNGSRAYLGTSTPFGQNWLEACHHN